MTPDRFAALAAAYGGDLTRWPLGEREAAERHLAQAPAAAAILSREGDLDRALEAGLVPPPTTDRHRRIATLLQSRQRAREGRGRWLPGVWVVGALASGMAMGSAAVALTLVPAAFASGPDGGGALYEQSSFGDLTSFDDVGPPAKGT